MDMAAYLQSNLWNALAAVITNVVIIGSLIIFMVVMERRGASETDTHGNGHMGSG